MSILLKQKITIFIILLSFLSVKLTAFNNDKDNNKITKVVIDAGHGGEDPGASGKKGKEKDIVLAIALKVGKYIQDNNPEVEVIYTRQEDVFIPLYERANIANKNKADLFISIHANANPNSIVKGTETYVMGLHKDEENLAVAMKENAVITLEKDYGTKYEGYDPKSPESFIVFSLLQNTYLEQSLEFASYTQDQFREKVQRQDRGVKQAGFLVLWKTTMPSVLIETGFITNREEEQYLMSETGQDLIASAIYRSFRNYKNSIESRSVLLHSINKSKTIEVPHKQNDSIPVNVKDTLHFKIQISTSSKPIDTNAEFFQKALNIKGINKIEELNSTHNYKYTVGNTSTYGEIEVLLKDVKIYYPDAFIIAIKNGKIVPLNELINNRNK